MKIYDLEAKFGVTLPSSYKQLLIEYPVDLTAIGPMVGGELEQISRYELLESPESIFEVNKEIRDGIAIMPEEAQEAIWPKFMFAIGQKGTETFAVKCTADDDERVFQWNCYDRNFKLKAQSIQDFIAQLRADAEVA